VPLRCVKEHIFIADRIGNVVILSRAVHKIGACRDCAHVSNVVFDLDSVRLVSPISFSHRVKKCKNKVICVLWLYNKWCIFGNQEFLHQAFDLPKERLVKSCVYLMYYSQKTDCLQYLCTFHANDGRLYKEMWFEICYPLYTKISIIRQDPLNHYIVDTI
jgi:hypothetical protein